MGGGGKDKRIGCPEGVIGGLRGGSRHRGRRGEVLRWKIGDGVGDALVELEGEGARGEGFVGGFDGVEEGDREGGDIGGGKSLWNKDLRYSQNVVCEVGLDRGRIGLEAFRLREWRKSKILQISNALEGPMQIDEIARRGRVGGNGSTKPKVAHKPTGFRRGGEGKRADGHGVGRCTTHDLVRLNARTKEGCGMTALDASREHHGGTRLEFEFSRLKKLIVEGKAAQMDRFSIVNRGGPCKFKEFILTIFGPFGSGQSDEIGDATHFFTAGFEFEDEANRLPCKVFFLLREDRSPQGKGLRRLLRVEEGPQEQR